MASRVLMSLQVVVPPPQKLGAVPLGTRVIAPITGGSFEGPQLRGKLLPLANRERPETSRPNSA